MATRTGARYTHFEAWYCPEDEGGCSVLAKIVEDADGAPLPMEGYNFADAPEPTYECPNCNHRPLAHVSVTTADQYSLD